MKKNLKLIIGTIIGVSLLLFVLISTFVYINDKNKLTPVETKWINENQSTMQNINMVNNVDIYASNGHGVFYDFINDFQKEYSIKVNPITYNYIETDNTTGFTISNTINDKSIVFSEDHYVLISKQYRLINNINDLNNVNIGILTKDNEYLTSYLPNLTFKPYNSISDLTSAFEANEAITYMLVPKELYLSYTIKNNFQFIYHFSDIKSYLVYQMNDDTFSNVLKKYFSKWKKDSINKSTNTNMLKLFTDNLDLSEADIKNLTSKVYEYGFLNNSPYEVLMSGSYGGIVSEYLNGFSELSNVEFKYTKYRNYKMFNEAVNNGKVDLYFNYYITSNNYETINTGMDVVYYIIANENNDIVVNSLNSLKNKTVYVLEESILYDYLTKVDKVDVKTYKSIEELKRLAKKNNIIMLDKETYEYMANKELTGYNVRYKDITNNTYSFKVNTNDTFKKLFKTYVMTLDSKEVRINGLYNYNRTVTTGTVLMSIAKYIIGIVIATILIILILYKSSKKVKVFKKIKKEDKIKFIDQLTSLKNRNYLNENIDGWNKNTIYPQTTIMIDLNRVQEINDARGYEEGDKQIKAAANILIRTQLDNSDIIRTDGNEFLVYLVGYDERHITSYIKKLLKEFKDMPYDYGATIGFSMINDDLKTIEDAINESVEDMKSKK